MFHVQHSLFFGRTSEGNVRILKFNNLPHEWPKIMNEYPEAIIDEFVDADEWSSIVASMNKTGETGDRWKQACDFHNS